MSGTYTGKPHLWFEGGTWCCGLWRNGGLFWRGPTMADAYAARESWLSHHGE